MDLENSSIHTSGGEREEDMPLIPTTDIDHLRRSGIVVTETGEPALAEEWDYEPAPDSVAECEYSTLSTNSELAHVSPSQFVEFAIRMPNKELQTRTPFSFAGRRYLRAPYDTPTKRILLKAARQCEKCGYIKDLCSLSDGRLVTLEDLRVGNEVITLSADGIHTSVGRVTWKSDIFQKPCIKISTRQRHEITVARTHPLKKWNKWELAGDLRVGDRVAVVRSGGLFTHAADVSDERIRLTAYLIGDGCFVGNLAFTSLPGAKLDEFRSDVTKLGDSYRVYQHKNSSTLDIRLNHGTIRDWIEDDDLLGKKSAHKFLPPWVFELDRRQAALFLNRLWSTDGCIRKTTRSAYNIEYCSMSERLVRDVQALLWKFGIPSRIRKNWPNIYKKRGEVKYAHILRVETQEGFRCFLKQIGALGKSEHIELPDVASNNNLDTLPEEINVLLRKVIDSRGNANRIGRNADKDKSLYTSKLRATLQYAPTFDKLREYVEFFKKDTRYDGKLVQLLEDILTTDVYWDRITKIEDMGKQPCVDISIESTENFVDNGFITHNSTLLGNKCLAYCCLVNAFNVLYVSPTNAQTKTFSSDRLKDPMETSEIIRAWTNTELSNNVFLKQFINRSKITLRYAFHNADRVRGIPADMVLIDELQDVLTDNIPVIEECASHSAFKLFSYSGTPKSYDNAIEKFWSDMSTQNEWVVPCERHGLPNDPSTWHWNVLGEANIGREGLVCEKCKMPIFATHEKAMWASLNPNVVNKLKEPFEGYRIPQIMVPWMPWSEVLDKQVKLSRSLFFNEVLGLSYDSGLRPLTRQDVIDNCDEDLLMDERVLTKIKKVVGVGSVFMGIDWGTAENTYTVVSLGTYIDDYLVVFYVHRFEGPESDPVTQVDCLEQLIRAWNVRVIGADYGGGFDRNDALQRRVGKDRLWKYQYSTPSQKVKWEDKMRRFIVHRTEVMSDVFNAIRRRNVFKFPAWVQFEDPFGKDMLNIFSEYNEQRREIQYKNSPGCTDDTFHSIVFMTLASMLVHPRPDILIPTETTSSAILD